jgi:hypothetical protein
MKYLMHYYVDPITGEAFAEGGSGRNGKTHPAIPGLDVRFWFTNESGVDFCLSTVPEEQSTVGFDGVTTLTEAEWFDIVEAQFGVAKQAKMLALYEYVKGIKARIVDIWWHPSEITAAMALKVQESKLAVLEADDAAAAVVAPFVAMEANAREMSVIELAQRILANYNGLIAGEALVSGHRGLISDQIEALPFDRATIEAANGSFGSLGEFDITTGFAEILEQLGL